MCDIDDNEIIIQRYLHILKNERLKGEIEKILPFVPIYTKLYVTVIAPTLISFVDWVVKDSYIRGKNRLYFLSRDGYQMYLIAQRIVKLRKIPIACKYLHVSRYSMRMPGYHINIDMALDNICVGGIDITCRKILKRGGLTDVDCSKILGSVALPYGEDDILNYRQIQNVKAVLRDCTKFRELVYKYSLDAYNTSIEYLNQEGLFSDDKYSIVDSGWVGTLQCSIDLLIRSVKPDIFVDGYYFGMYEIPCGVSKDRFHTYYFGACDGLNRKSAFSNSLFETIVSSREGTTIGYMEECGEIVPIFSELTNPNDEQLASNIQALIKLLNGINHLDELEITSKKEIELLLNTFMGTPTELEIKAYGDDRFSDDVLDGCFKKVAAELSCEQIKDQWFISKLLIILGLKHRVVYESAWIEGSAVRCGVNVKSNLAHIRFYKKLIYARKQMKMMITRKSCKYEKKDLD